MSEIKCPCQSGLDYSHCCEPFIEGIMPAPTPLALMRSRYTSYVLQKTHYLVTTWLIDESLQEALTHSITESYADTDWQGLHIISAEPAQSDDIGFVEFMAHYQEHSSSRHHTLYERSRFQKIAGKWYYVDGIKPAYPRNDLCPCGSGKKYKKCCYE